VNPLLKVGVLSPLCDRPPSCQNGRLGFTQGFYYGLSQEAKEHTENLTGGTFFLLKTQEAQALFEKITASEKESEEYDARENSCTTKIDALTQMFQGLTLNQTSASEEYQAEQEFQAQPSDLKKRLMSRISSNAILDKLWNKVSRPALPVVPCILGPFKVQHTLCDWGASMNILPKMVYDCLDEDSLVSIAGKFHCGAALRDSRECIDRVPRFFDVA
jgi:hypothetical protein